MKKTIILFLAAVCAATVHAYGQDGFRFDTIRSAVQQPRTISGSPDQRPTQPVRMQRPQERPPRKNDMQKQELRAVRASMKPPGYWTIGGNIGIGFGDFTDISITPKVGYRFNNTISIGGGFSYNYYDHHHYDYTLNYFGMNVFAQVFPVQYITLFLQPELQRRWGRVWGHDDRKDLFGCLLIGGGLVIPTGMRGGVTVTFFYDLLQNPYTPYGDKIGYSVGYSFGL